MNRTTHIPKSPSQQRAAFTLIELLIVLAVLGILASAAITASDSANGMPALKSGARIFASDLRLARASAVQYSTSWSVNFDVRTNTYELVHSGSGSPPPLENPLVPSTQSGGKYLVDVANIVPSTHRETGLRIVGGHLETSGTSVASITFGPLGGTGPARNENTVIWIEHENVRGKEYLPLTVAWVTGQVFVGEPTDVLPKYLTTL